MSDPNRSCAATARLPQVLETKGFDGSSRGVIVHAFYQSPPMAPISQGAGMPPLYRPKLRKLRFGGYNPQCPVSAACGGKNTLQVAEVQVFDSSNINYVTIATKAAADSSLKDGSGAHGPELAADQSGSTWFGSGSSGADAWLELDMGAWMRPAQPAPRCPAQRLHWGLVFQAPALAHARMYEWLLSGAVQPSAGERAECRGAAACR